MQLNDISLGEIYQVDLNDASGHEQDKQRPAVALVKHETGLVLVVPFTSKIDSKRFPFTLEIKKSKMNKLACNSVGMVF
jgi:mRNA-degrading endonuclease toxin of MazEF toxin-antitoxin module